MTLSIVRGVPGQGKSTWAKKNFNCILLENDQFMYQDGQYNWTPEKCKAAVKRLAELVEYFLSKDIDVCVANTFTRVKYVEFYKRIAEKHGASFKVYRMTNHYGNIHDVPKNTLENMNKTFEDYPGEEFVK